MALVVKASAVPRELRVGGVVIRDVLMRVDPEELDRALGAWNVLWADKDRSLAIDGKTMRRAVDEQGRQVHIMSAVGHESKACYTQKKWAT